MTSGPRVFLADDHTLLCELIADLLSSQFNVVGTASDGASAVTEVARLRPDVAILDIFLPRLNGIEAALRIREAAPSTKIIFLTASEDPALAARTMRIPGASFLLKTSSASELPIAIWSAIRGKRYVTPYMMEKIENGECDDVASLDLTAREREVVQLLAEGKPMKQAAALLNISTRTVAFHKYGVMRKLGLHSSAELVRLAVTHRLVGPVARN